MPVNRRSSSRVHVIGSGQRGEANNTETYPPRIAEEGVLLLWLSVKLESVRVSEVNDDDGDGPPLLMSRQS